MSAKNKNINSFLFVLAMSVRYLQTVFIDYWPSFLQNFDILIIIFTILFYLLQIVFKNVNKINFKYKYEIINIVTVVLTFIILTIYYGKKNYNGVWLSRTNIELSYIMIAVLLAFCCFNLFDYLQINKCMKQLLVIFIILYLFELIFKDISLSVFLNITLTGSYSPTESQKLSSTAMLMFYWFYTFRTSSNKKYFIISFVYLICVFKRPLIVGAVLLIVLDYIFNLNREIKNKWIWIAKALFIVGTILWTSMLYNKNINIIKLKYGIDLNVFTESRAWFFNALVNYGYKTSGYGTTTIELGKAWFNCGERYIEMDLVKIYMETGIIGLMVFINNYFNLVRNNLYNFFIMLTIFVTLLFSHSLTEPAYWAGIMLLLGSNIYYKEYISKYDRTHIFKPLNLKIVIKK